MRFWTGPTALAALWLLPGSAALAQASAPAAQAVAVAAAEDLSALLQSPQRCEAGPPSETGPLRLASVLRAVICNHPGVRRGAGLATQAQAALDQARARSWPSLNASTGADANRGSSTSWGASVSLDWVLFDFGQRRAETEQASRALAAVLDEQRVEVINALGSAALLYAAAQVASGRLEASSTNLRTAGDNVRASEARFGGGASTLNEALQAKTALAQARLEQSRAMSVWLAARGSLAVAMRLPAQAPLELPAQEGAADAEAPVAIDALLEEARSAHPRVSAARARLAQAQARADAVQAERWGRVSISASSGRSRPSYGAEAETTGSAQITWSVPLFDGGLLNARKSDALGEVQITQAALQDTLADVELQVWQAAQTLTGDRQAARDSQVVLESAETSLRVAGERFRLGVGNFTDVLTAQNTAASARYQLVEAQANLRRSELRLAAAVGRFGSLLRF